MLHCSVGVRLERLRQILPVKSHLPLWIAGRWCEPSVKSYLPTIDPTTGAELIDVAMAAPADIARAVDAANIVQPKWWDADGQDRARILRRIAEAIRAHGDALGLLDTLDAGRPIRDSSTRDVERAARIFEFFAGVTDRIRGSVIPVQPGKMNLVHKEPYGVVGAITPWNYPLTNAAGKIAPALATGNAVVLKPAEEAPLSALFLASVIHDAGLPAGMLNVLPGLGSVAGDALVRHPDTRKISFTGSTVVGRHIARVCGDLLKSVTLELGGKTAFLVFSDADLGRAADALVFSAFNNAGQTCTAASRLLVQNCIADEFLARVGAQLKDLRIGDPLDPNTQVGPVISKRHYDEILRRVAQADSEGLARAPIAEHFVPDHGYFISPIIFDNVDPASPIACEEIFGPVITVHRFADDFDAVRLTNGTKYGLATTIWTESLRRSHGLARQIESGIVWVNTVHSLHPGSPYGGYKQSGLGIEMGIEALHQHMRTKTMWIELQPWQTSWS